MISIEQGLQIIQNQQVKLKTVNKSLRDCIGFSLSQDIPAAFDMPSFDNSAMDGFALCGISREYAIVGEVAAGDECKLILKEGEAARIFTGARVPENTTAVMMQEKTKVSGKKLFLEQEPKPGQSIRKRGEELKKGQVVFKEGYTITPAGIGMIASLGIHMVEVFKKPAINLITTGNELVKPGKIKKNGQIYESNSYALASACEDYNFTCNDKLQIRDDFQAIKTGIKDALQTADVLILSGGISVGDYDFVKQALEDNGVEAQFYKVFQKPGKPLYFGRKEDKFIFALPGNPASSLSCFYIYVLPLLFKLSGSVKIGLDPFYFPISHDFDNKSDRPAFLKAKVHNGKVKTLDGQGSSMMQSMAIGNALVFIGGSSSVKKGDPVKCFLIS